MSGTTPPEDSARDPQPSLSEAADSIEADFQALIEHLDRHIELLVGSNSEALIHLARAKTFADRGLRLSRRLARRAGLEDAGS